MAKRKNDWLNWVKVVSDAEAEEADMVVCCTADMPSYFSNNVYTICHVCEAVIYHRPHAPKKPKKVCMNCAVELAERERKAEQEGK